MYSALIALGREYAGYQSIWETIANIKNPNISLEHWFMLFLGGGCSSKKVKLSRIDYKMEAILNIVLPLFRDPQVKNLLKDMDLGIDDNSYYYKRSIDTALTPFTVPEGFPGSLLDTINNKLLEGLDLKKISAVIFVGQARVWRNFALPNTIESMVRRIELFSKEKDNSIFYGFIPVTYGNFLSQHICDTAPVVSEILNSLQDPAVIANLKNCFREATKEKFDRDHLLMALNVWWADEQDKLAAIRIISNRVQLHNKFQLTNKIPMELLAKVNSKVGLRFLHKILGVSTFEVPSEKAVSLLPSAEELGNYLLPVLVKRDTHDLAKSVMLSIEKLQNESKTRTIIDNPENIYKQVLERRKCLEEVDLRLGSKIKGKNLEELKMLLVLLAKQAGSNTNKEEKMLLHFRNTIEYDANISKEDKKWLHTQLDY